MLSRLNTARRLCKGYFLGVFYECHAARAEANARASGSISQLSISSKKNPRSLNSRLRPCQSHLKDVQRLLRQNSACTTKKCAVSQLSLFSLQEW